MANVISQYWSEGTPTQMELFDDADKDFETMRKLREKNSQCHLPQ